MSATLSPRQLAEAIGVSESSLRRWADDGRIAMTRTAGGHRRIPVPEAVQFIREMKLPVAKPAVLGLPELQPSDDQPRGDEAERLTAMLTEGQAVAARGLIVHLFLSGWDAARIIDGPVHAALDHIGELWHDNPLGIAVEHRATDICFQSLHQLRSLLPLPADDAPTAVGGSPAGDLYSLPSTAAAAVVAEAGYREVNLGANIPAAALCATIRKTAPALVWLSIKAPISDKAVRGYLGEVADAAAETRSAVAIGGRDIPAAVFSEWPHVQRLQNMVELASFAKGCRHQLRDRNADD